jgi:hypothetical protein
MTDYCTAALGRTMDFGLLRIETGADSCAGSKLGDQEDTLTADTGKEQILS